MDAMLCDVLLTHGADALQGSSLSIQEGNTVHFMVTAQKGWNYGRYCHQVVPARNPVEIIRQYTEHTTNHFSRVNLALAADTENLNRLSDYICELRASVCACPLLEDGPMYRGVDLSSREIDEMERLQNFFIPSFTSTSVERGKSYNKSAMMVIKVPYATSYACSITDELSHYHEQEREVLLACYSAFRLERVEKEGSKRILALYLDEHLSTLPSLCPVPVG